MPPALEEVLYTMKRTFYVKRLVTIALALICLCPLGLKAAAPSRDFICLGGDLSDKQRQEMLRFLNPANDPVETITISIDEEKELLADVVPFDVIGSRSLSSVRVTLLGPGLGIEVQTSQISWVTSKMFSSALVTAGVTDAKVVAAAPIEVSGTAALAGMLKAYEQAAGNELLFEAKALASEELVRTGELGELIGKDQAAELFAYLKEQILTQNLSDDESVHRLVAEAAQRMDFSLTDEQIDEIAKLLLKISSLEINPNDLKNQLETLQSGYEKISGAAKTTSGLFDGIRDTIENILRWFARLFEQQG
jgi:uncharacterized protein YpuA (DUF1002 family)